MDCIITAWQVYFAVSLINKEGEIHIIESDRIVHNYLKYKTDIKIYYDPVVRICQIIYNICSIFIPFP